MSRLGIRRRLFLLVVAAVAVSIAALIVGFNLILADNLSGNADSLVRSRAAAELGLVRPVGDRLVVGDAPNDAAPDIEVWVFSRGRTLEAPDGAAKVAAAARRLAGGPERLVDLGSEDTRLFATPVVFGGRRLGTVVAGVSLAPYEQTQRTALLGSLGLGLAVLLLVALAARWLLASSLRPVARITRQAAAWSEHDLDHRFGLGEPHDELTELAATLDGLLDRLAASLRREHRFSAELSHELRTPLARITAEAELALHRERQPDDYRQALGLILASAQQMTRAVDVLVAAARHEAGGYRGACEAHAAASGAVEASRQLADERGLALTLQAPAAPLRVGVDLDLAERILQPVIENACSYGRERVEVRIAREGAGVTFVVEDDGPGVDRSEHERIFEPAVRGAAGVNGRPGAGLGLALARRLARTVSGDVVAGSRDGGGRFVVWLPGG